MIFAPPHVSKSLTVLCPGVVETMLQGARLSDGRRLHNFVDNNKFLYSSLAPRQSVPGLQPSAPVQCLKADQSTFHYPCASTSHGTSKQKKYKIPSVSSIQDLNRFSRGRRSGCVDFELRSFRKGLDGESDGWDPSTELGVPEDQRPVNELVALQESTLYSWAQLEPKEFGLRILGLWTALFVFLGGPIAAASFEPTKMPLEFALAGGAGAVFGTAVLLLRMYLGWSYVGDRLLSAVVPYEETGWYDGQLWVKPPEVKPVMVRLKQTLLGSASLMAASTLALVLILPQSVEDTVVYVPRRNSEGEAMAMEQKVGFRVRDLTNPPLEVLDDDDVAAAAAAAANGRPVYCQDRYYRALAGGQYCKWSDLKR